MSSKLHKVKFTSQDAMINTVVKKIKEGITQIAIINGAPDMLGREPGYFVQFQEEDRAVFGKALPKEAA